MKIYCINLKRSTERRAKMSAELEKLGLPYEFIDAVDGRALRAAERDAAYNSWRTRLRHGKDLTAGELGCAMSHLAFFRKIIESNDVGFVLEDDVAFLEGARVAFEKAEKFLREAKGPTLVQLPGLERDVRCDKNGTCGFVKVPFAMGTYAYGINPEAARLLLAAFTPIKMPIDKYDYLIKHYGLNFFVYSDIILKVDMEGESTVGYDRFFSMCLIKKVLYKVWRCFGIVVDKILLMSDKGGNRV